MVSPGALARLDAKLGDTVTLTDPRTEFTIVGVLKSATLPDSAQTLFVPAGTGLDAAEGLRTWFTPDWQPTADQIPELNHNGVIVYARDLATPGAGRSMPPPVGQSGPSSRSSPRSARTSWCCWRAPRSRSALVASSARWPSQPVSAHRAAPCSASCCCRAPSSASSEVSSAPPSGFGLAAIALALLDDGNAMSYWGFNVPWPLVIGIVIFAIVVGTASALLPARAATRGDVLAALRGARRPVSVRANRPLWGSLLVVVGLAITVASGLTLGALNAADPVDYSSPLRSVAVVGIIAGPILFQIGVVLAGHWILSLLARAGAHLGIAPRIATRDAAANPSRIVPAFGAIAACVFIASFALTAVSVSNAAAATRWSYGSPLGTVHVDVFTTYRGGRRDGDRRARGARRHRTGPHRDRTRTGDRMFEHRRAG